MSQKLSFHCDCCGERIDDEQDCPLVAYLVVGRVGGDGGVRFYEDELPPYVEALMQHPVWRRDYCVHCFGEKMQAAPAEVEALVDKAVREHGLAPDAAERIRARSRRARGGEMAKSH